MNQDILGGLIFVGMFVVMSIGLLGKMCGHIDKIEEIINKEDRYVN